MIFTIIKEFFGGLTKGLEIYFTERNTLIENATRPGVGISQAE